MTSCKLLLPDDSRLHPVFHCDLLSHSITSISLIRPRQAKIEENMEEHSINYIDDVKLDTWPRRRGPYLQFLSILLILILRNGWYLRKLMIVKNLRIFYKAKKGIIFHLERFISNLLHNIPKEI